MIDVWIHRYPTDRRIRTFQVKGHAEFAEPGKDLVCAAVSAITVGTVNAVEALLGVNLACEMEKGFMLIDVPELQRDKQEQVQLLLESMRVMLQTIEETYGKFISILDEP